MIISSNEMVFSPSVEKHFKLKKGIAAFQISRYGFYARKWHSRMPT